MSAQRARTLRLVVGFLASAVLGVGALWFAFRGVTGDDATQGASWSDVGHSLRATPMYAVFAYVGVFVAQTYLRTERWRVQVFGLSGHRPGFGDSLAINCIGSAALFLLPLRLGEVARPTLSARRGLMPTSAGFAVSLVERVADGLTTTAFFGVIMLLARDLALPRYVTVAGLVSLLVFGGASVILLVAWRFRAASVRFWRGLISAVHAGLAERLVGILEGFLAGVACFRTRGDVVRYLGYTVAYWFITGLGMAVLLGAMVPGVHPLAAWFCLSFLVIGSMVPSLPGSVGTFQAVIGVALALFSVPTAPGAAFMILLHVLSGGLFVAFGLVFVLLGHVQLRDLIGRIEPVEQP